jgi:dGTPase
MKFREVFEDREMTFLASYACPARRSRGREREEPPCPIRTDFQRDRDRIIYSNAFRRLKHKTQVFLAPLGDQYRTRLTHTLEVAQIGRTIARALRLNEDLTEAIALGHDLGHTPFGHGGEIVLRDIHPGGFSHTKHSLRVVDVLEKQGAGLNLTWEVRDGILKHSKGHGDILPDDHHRLPATIEGIVVRVADIIAYLNHDLDDAIRSGVIRESQVPARCVEVFGRTHSERITTMVNDFLASSAVAAGRLQPTMSRRVNDAMVELREFLHANVYRAPAVHQEFVKAKRILKDLYHHFLDHPDILEHETVLLDIDTSPRELPDRQQRACDVIASMTDHSILDLYERLFFPSPLV